MPPIEQLEEDGTADKANVGSSSGTTESLSAKHYTDGRRWSYISNAWIFADSWSDSEEIAMLRANATASASSAELRWIVNAFLEWHEGNPCPDGLFERARAAVPSGVKVWPSDFQLPG